MKMSIRAIAAAAALAALPLAAETPNPSGRTTADVLTRLETFATAAMAQEKVPGMAYAVVKDGQVVFAKGYGKRRLGNASDDVTTGTLFEIGSTTKAFTSALVAMQVDAGKISWDDRVVTLLPDFRMYDPWVTQEFRVWGYTVEDAVKILDRTGFTAVEYADSLDFPHGGTLPANPVCLRFRARG